MAIKSLFYTGNPPDIGVEAQSENLIPFPYQNTGGDSGDMGNSITYSVSEDGGILFNGTASEDSNTGYFILAYEGADNKLPIGKYTFSCNAIPDKFRIVFVQYYEDGTGKQTTLYLNGGFEKIINYDSKVTHYEIFCAADSGCTINQNVYVKLQYGTVATPYSSYLPEGTAVEFTACGKNLFDIDAIPSNNTAISNTGSLSNAILVDGTVIRNTISQYNDSWSINVPINVKVGQVTLSAMVRTPDAAYNQISFDLRGYNSVISQSVFINTNGSEWQSISRTFTIPQDGVVYVHIQNIKDTTGANQIVEFYNVQLEYGTTATEYEPYSGQTYNTEVGGDKIAVSGQYTNIFSNTLGVYLSQNRLANSYKALRGSGNVIQYSGTANGVNLFDTMGEVGRGSTYGVTYSQGGISCSSIGSGSSTYVIFSKVYPAGNYVFSGTYAVTSGDNQCRVIISTESSGFTYNTYYGAYVRPFASGGSTTISTTEPFTLGVAFSGNSGSVGTYTNLMLQRGDSMSSYVSYPYDGIGVTVCGNNIFNPQKVSVKENCTVDDNGYGFTRTGQEEAGFYWYTTAEPLAFLRGQIITLNADVDVDGPYIGFQFAGTDYFLNNFSTAVNGKVTVTSTVPEQTNFIKIIISAGNTVTNKLSNIRVNIGSEDLGFSPYSGYDLTLQSGDSFNFTNSYSNVFTATDNAVVSVGGCNQSFININEIQSVNVLTNLIQPKQIVGLSGKNLFDLSNNLRSSGCAIAQITNNSITLQVESTTTSLYSVFPISVKDGETITLSGSWTASGTNDPRIILWWLQNNTFLSGGNIGDLATSGSSITVTAHKPENAQTLCVLLYATRNTTGVLGDTATFTNVQVEYGSSATQYAPYVEPGTDASFIVCGENLANVVSATNPTATTPPALSNTYGTTINVTSLALTAGTLTVTQTQNDSSSGYGAYQNGYIMFQIPWNLYGKTVYFSADVLITQALRTDTPNLIVIPNGTPYYYMPIDVTNLSTYQHIGIAIPVSTQPTMNRYGVLELRLCGLSLRMKNINIQVSDSEQPFEPYNGTQYSLPTGQFTIIPYYPNIFSNTYGVVENVLRSCNSYKDNLIVQTPNLYTGGDITDVNSYPHVINLAASGIKLSMGDTISISCSGWTNIQNSSAYGQAIFYNNGTPASSYLPIGVVSEGSNVGKQYVVTFESDVTHLYLYFGSVTTGSARGSCGGLNIYKII